MPAGLFTLRTDLFPAWSSCALPSCCPPLLCPPRCPGILLAIPLAIGFGVSRVVAQPLWAYAERLDPAAFAATDNQKVEGAHELHVEELRLRMVGWRGGAGQGQLGGGAWAARWW